MECSWNVHGTFMGCSWHVQNEKSPKLQAPPNWGNMDSPETEHLQSAGTLDCLETEHFQTWGILDFPETKHLQTGGILDPPGPGMSIFGMIPTTLRDWFPTRPFSMVCRCVAYCFQMSLNLLSSHCQLSLASSLIDMLWGAEG